MKAAQCFWSVFDRQTRQLGISAARQRGRGGLVIHPSIGRLKSGSRGRHVRSPRLAGSLGSQGPCARSVLQSPAWVLESLSRALKRRLLSASLTKCVGVGALDIYLDVCLSICICIDILP